jgi:hypothetical protein
MEQLGSNPFVYPISQKHVQYSTRYPDYLRFSLVCTTLSHRMNRIRPSAYHGALAEAFYRYKGVVIRSLREDPSFGRKQISDAFIAGIITLLLIDVGLRRACFSCHALMAAFRSSKALRQTGDVTWRQYRG